MEGATLQLSSALISQAYIHRLSQDEQLGEGFSFFSFCAFWPSGTWAVKGEFVDSDWSLEALGLCTVRVDVLVLGLFSVANKRSVCSRFSDLTLPRAGIFRQCSQNLLIRGILLSSGQYSTHTVYYRTTRTPSKT